MLGVREHQLTLLSLVHGGVHAYDRVDPKLRRGLVLDLLLRPHAAPPRVLVLEARQRQDPHRRGQSRHRRESLLPARDGELR